MNHFFTSRVSDILQFELERSTVLSADSSPDSSTD